MKKHLWFFGLMPVLLLYWLLTTPMDVNDDAFVYFNYARHIAQGDFFAYDARHIPSEGFTSLIWTLMLGASDWLGINLQVAAMVFGIVALLGAVWVACTALLREGPLAALAFLITSIFLLTDDSVRQLSGMAMETLLAPVPLIATACYAAYLRRHGVTAQRAYFGFWSLCFLAFLVRPENIVLCGIPSLVLLLSPACRPALLRTLPFFAAFSIAFFAWKYWLFGDLMPTGYYRKMTSHMLPGVSRVWQFIHEYAGLLELAMAGYAACLFYRRRMESVLPSILVLTMVGSMLLCLPISPITDWHYRYFIVAIVFAKLMGGYALTLLWQAVVTYSYPPRYRLDLPPVLEKPWRFVVAQRWVRSIAPVLPVMVVLAVWLSGMYGHRPDYQRERLHLLGQAEQAMDQHFYVQLGRAMQQMGEDFTFASGDAGAVPFTWHGTFIDTNGLTEPGIARLFPWPEGDAKTQAYADYMLAHRPTLLVISFGVTKDGERVAAAGAHDPFHGATPIGVYERYHAAGYRYLCTLEPLPQYDLHLAVDPSQPQAARVARGMLDYCATHGYVEPHGLTIVGDGRKVVFPRWHS